MAEIGKKPKLKRDWEGLKVQTLRVFRNGNIEIPSGTTCTVERNYGGLYLITDPCEKCGVRVYITKVPEDGVLILKV